MYPQGELTRLVLRKRELRSGLAAKRAAWSVAAEQAAKPLVWLDLAIALVRRATPWLSALQIPLVLFTARKAAPKRASFLDSLAKWGPLVVQTTRCAATVLSQLDTPSPSAKAKPRSLG